MQKRPSAERTRSKRWRSGTRRNKKHPVAHIQICPMPKVCLVHRRTSGVVPPRHPSMAMRLTRCEQKWVDDTRAGLHHTHIHFKRPSESWQWAIWAIYRRINSARMAASGIINAESPTGRIRPDIDINPETGQRFQFAMMGLGRAVGKAAEQQRQIEVARAAGQDVMIVGNARYPRSMDISDRWYPRGE